MASGGARTQSGPAPDINSLRSGAVQWTNLPGDGYDGPVPDWPLTLPTPRELELWEDMWCKPQALMWARLGQRHEVAMFCRNLAAAEMPMAPVVLQTVVLRYLDSLGLSTAGLARHHWRIVPSEAEVQRVAPPTATVRRTSAKSRLKVVAPDGE